MNTKKNYFNFEEKEDKKVSFIFCSIFLFVLFFLPQINASSFGYNKIATTKFVTEVNYNYNSTSEADPHWTANLTGGLGADLNLNSNRLTNVGELIMSGITNSMDIVPITNNLYSLGNSTNWFDEVFATDIYSENINTTNITSESVQSEEVNTSNLTIAGYEVYKNQGGDLTINLD